ncbi:hypothetical protein SD70_02335 [Gordoniibacillus kamchatkensis]|uniref:J domain-containing protein n=1 Tax=Gordoniibacillus kamchatkensis TaxID=1590651 RepID=A0ABR5ALX8_9BACL|nr:hypothetical protein [Paenibacillus sp. VKM B-2647]KIL42045.1 hypothetical protein SD70_02335 [Paenibacillus sp. VKM B-2647]
MEKVAWAKREGIFDIDEAVAGLPALPPPMPECFWKLGFGSVPNEQQLTSRWKELLKTEHPDIKKGNDVHFRELKAAYEEAIKLLNR